VSGEQSTRKQKDLEKHIAFSALVGEKLEGEVTWVSHGMGYCSGNASVELVTIWPREPATRSNQQDGSRMPVGRSSAAAIACPGQTVQELDFATYTVYDGASPI